MKALINVLCDRDLADTSKAPKDLLQAAVLGAALVETDASSLQQAAQDVPSELLQAARSRLPELAKLLPAHPQTLQEFEHALTRSA